ncbi:hypothetical protein [Mycolicibacterium sp. BiH015]|uniref:hypothetical protein n=1 Tax=Mycolicibacterium sp. BiH015 TaxID=3018808 RepID=UPI0022DEED41|nr:hypothetical protein [Mycolicibacterium sp. BiH015]
MIAASMPLAQEVYETFGPGMARVTDPTEAAIRNKHHVWFRELSGGEEASMFGRNQRILGDNKKS